MTLGIKVGPQGTSIRDLEQTATPFAEVWFRPDRLGDYDALFHYMIDHHVAIGLHHWSAVDDMYWPSLAFEHDRITDETMKSIQQTIDTAARINAVYVNIHPGSRAKIRYSYSDRQFRDIDTPLPTDIAYPTVVKNLNHLNDYALSKGVLLTVETVPERVKKDDSLYGTHNASDAIDIYELSMVDLADLVPTISIANDFGHTAAVLDTDRTAILGHLTAFTDHYAARTRLLHIGFALIPSFGLDFHDSLENPLFDTDASIPNCRETRQLLAQFVHRPDVYALVEPSSDHIGNYRLLTQLVRDAL
jgi:sugar phosphate isomerase/epimerase